MKKIIALLLMMLLLTACGSEELQPTTQPVLMTQPADQLTTQPATEPVTEPVTEPTTQPAEQPTTEPATEPATRPTTTSENFRIHFVDVGQADGAIIECDGEFAVIDAGYPENGPQMVEYLRTLGAEKLSLVVATHPHGDHIGGLPDVLGAFETDTVWSSQLPYTNQYVYGFTDAVKSSGASLEKPRPGEVFQLGGASIEVIGPMNLEYEDANDLSLVLMVQYGENRFLMTGDMEELAEHELVEAGVDLKADVLKVGHHGSYSSSSYRFLREVLPTYSVISCGAGNEYGHPHDVTVSRLQDADTIIYRTDRMYTVIAESDGTHISFTWGNSFTQPWSPEEALQNAA